jgi:pimeloyl-ACP methyl ester carboxylesterase
MHVQVYSQSLVKNVMIDGTGPTLIFLHGATADMLGLEKATQELKADFKVIRMSNFNTQYASEGKLLPANYSIKMESKGVNATLDSLKITESIILVGSSYGGLIALDFAMKYPKKIKALILLEPPAFSLPAVVKENLEGVDQIKHMSLQHTPTAEITEQQVEQYRCMQVKCDSVNIRNLPQWKVWMQQKNRLRGLSSTFLYKFQTKKLNDFKRPVLIVTGTQSGPLGKRINELLHAELPTSKIIFVNSGHAIPTTAPKELANAILEFVHQK